MRVRLFLADDDVSVRQSVAFVLRRTCNCEIVGEAENGRDALRQCETLKPDVLIVDLRMPVLSGVSLLREIRRRKLGIAVLIYTAAVDNASLLEAADAMPEGFVLKSDELPLLRQAVQAVSAGASFWSPQAGDLRNQGKAGQRRVSVLTAAELEVMRLVVQGKTTKEIAAQLHKGVDTVKHQRQSIMDKLGVHHAFALAKLAREAGWSE